VFAAAFLAGAAAAVGVNRSLDVHLARRQPRVECEPIFVALHSLPQGSPVTVWDVALRDWPKAMLPAAALRPHDAFDGMVLRHAVREGQPLLSVQLAKAGTPTTEQVADTTVAPQAPAASDAATPPTDLWAPAEVPPAAGAAQDSRPDQVVAPDQVAVISPPEPVVAGTTVPEPVVASPVIVAVPSSTDTDVDPILATVNATEEPATTQSREPTARYLVVPERIALEADRSFAPAARPDTRPPAAPQSTAAPQSIATAQPPQARSAPAQQGRATLSADRTSSNRDRQTQRPPRSASSQPLPAPQRGGSGWSWSLRSLLPGMGAAEPASSPAPTPRGSSQTGIRRGDSTTAR